MDSLKTESSDEFSSIIESFIITQVGLMKSLLKEEIGKTSKKKKKKDLKLFNF